jgi:hypothetical protein
MRDEFATYLNGTLEGNFFVGAPQYSFAVDFLTGFITTGLGSYNQDGGDSKMDLRYLGTMPDRDWHRCLSGEKPSPYVVLLL